LQVTTPVSLIVKVFSLCPIALEQAIVNEIAKAKPKAIIAVHFVWRSVSLEAVRAVANAYQIQILEDSAEALGSSYRAQNVVLLVIWQYHLM
jgi:dTDP-4-amino-4,6-dideoxygalactose transaminase